MPTGHIPILQIKTKDGEWLPVNAIGGQVASKVLYNNTYPTVEQALDYLFENGTGGSAGGSTESELFIVNVQAQSGKDAYTITSHDKTYEQIDEAYKAGKQVLLAFTITDDNTTCLIPLAFATETDYEFSMFFGVVFTVCVDSTDTWGCYAETLDAYSIKAKISADTSAESQSLQTILNYIVYPAVEKAHEHSNKDLIDKLSVLNGKLQYNDSDVGLKGDKGDPGKTPIRGTDYWTAADIAEIKKYVDDAILGGEW